jgi:hypothetical protein
MKVLRLLFCTELKDRNRSPHSNGISDTFLQKISDGLDQRHPRRRQCVIRQAPIIAPLPTKTSALPIKLSYSRDISHRLTSTEQILHDEHEQCHV